jgi:hypothetical protein
MTLRKLLVTLLVLWLGLVGVVCGFLSLACLLLVLFWQGLGISTLILALACLFCLGLALLLAGRMSYEGLGDRPARQESLLSRFRKVFNPFERSAKKGSTRGVAEGKYRTGRVAPALE